MPKNKKQKTTKRWMKLIIFSLVFLIIFSFGANLLVDPIARSLIAKRSPELAKQLPKESLEWNLWSGVKISELKLKSLSPVFKEIHAQEVWINISYFSLLGDDLSVDHITVEKLSLKSSHSSKNTLNQLSRYGSRVLHPELQKLIADCDIQVLQLQLKNRQNQRLLTLDKLNLETDFHKSNLEIQGDFLLANLLGLEVREGEYELKIYPNQIKVEIPEVRWKGAEIELSSEIRRKGSSLKHESQVKFNSLPLSSGTDLVFQGKFPFDTKIKGKIDAQGPLFKLNQWTARGNLKSNSITVEGLKFQESPLIQKQAPSMQSIRFKELNIPQFKLKNGKLTWDSLQAKGRDLEIMTQGSIKLNGFLYLNGRAFLSESSYEELPSLTRTAFNKVDSLPKPYTIPLEIQGNFQNQTLLNTGSLVRNAVGNQFQSIGSGLRNLFGR